MAKLRLNDELGRQIIELLKVGATIEDAADALLLHRTTIHKWLHDGERAVGGVLRRFYEEVQRAKVTPKVKVINTVITRAIEGDMVAAKMYLNRFPEWNPQHNLNISGNADKPLQTVQMSLNEWTAEQDKRAKQAEETMQLFNEQADDEDHQTL